MASSFITKDDIHGFWVGDALMKIIYWGYLNVIDTPNSGMPNWMMGKFREYLHDCALGYFSGFITLGLDEDVLSREGWLSGYNYLIECTKAFFLSKGDYMPVEELNEFQTNASTRNVWIEPFETKRAIKVLEFIEDVINDRMSIKVDDRIDYSF